MTKRRKAAPENTTTLKPRVEETSKTKSVAPAPAEKPTRSARTDTTMGIRKEYSGDERLCKVTFRLPGIVYPNAASVCIVGDFNDWETNANSLKKQQNGDYAIELELEAGKEYQFRYLINGARWENDWHADKYVKNPYGDADNSVVIV